MRAFVVFFFVLGVFFIIHGIYEQKLKTIEKNKRIEYRFIPRTYLEEQLEDDNISGKFSNMFQNAGPWFERNVTLSKTDKSDSDKKI